MFIVEAMSEWPKNEQIKNLFFSQKRRIFSIAATRQQRLKKRSDLEYKLAFVLSGSPLRFIYTSNLRVRVWIMLVRFWE